MNDDGLTDGELRRIVATSRDERERRTARRILNGRADAAPMPEPIVPAIPVWCDLMDLVEQRARAGRHLSLAEAGALVRDAIADLAPNGR